MLNGRSKNMWNTMENTMRTERMTNFSTNRTTSTNDHMSRQPRTMVSNRQVEEMVESSENTCEDVECETRCYRMVENRVFDVMLDELFDHKGGISRQNMSMTHFLTNASTHRETTSSDNAEHHVFRIQKQNNAKTKICRKWRGNLESLACPFGLRRR